MLGGSLSYPKRGEEWVKTVVIGGALSFVAAFIFVTILPVQGYFVRVLRSAANDEHEPPVFDDWESLFVDGIKMFAIQLAYVLVPFVLFVIAAFLTAGGAISASEGSGLGAGVGLFGGLLLLVSVVVGLLAAYLAPAALANFAYTDDLGAAFDFGTVRRVAFTSDYFVALLLAFVVGITLGLIAAVLTFLIVGVFLSFYVQVSIYYLIGRGYAKGLDLEPGGPAGAEAGTAATVE